AVGAAARASWALRWGTGPARCRCYLGEHSRTNRRSPVTLEAAGAYPSVRKRSLDDDRPVGRRYQPLRRFIAVLGHAPMLEREGSAASILRQLGACVRTLAIQENPARFMRDEDSPDVRPRALLVEALDRADLGSAALRDIRKEPYFDSVGTLLAITVGQMGHVPLFSGFDDLIRYPSSADELYW